MCSGDAETHLCAWGAIAGDWLVVRLRGFLGGNRCKGSLYDRRRTAGAVLYVIEGCVAATNEMQRRTQRKYKRKGSHEVHSPRAALLCEYRGIDSHSDTNTGQ